MALRRIEMPPRLPKRPADSHKGMYGNVLVIAGSRGMAGAAAMVGAATLRSGAGLVRIASPDEVQLTVAQFEPSYMTWPLHTNPEGQVDFSASKSTLERLVVPATVVAVGPGLGQSEDSTRLVRWVVESVKVPTVLDADALNAFGDKFDVSGSTRPIVITPHPGEFGRLIGRPTSEVQADREALAAAFAREHKVVVALKGAGTIVTDGDRVYVNTTGNPGMAKGGSGDVLTGVVSAMLAQGLPAFEAACLATYAHGLAGDIARDQSGEVGMIAGDIVDSLADTFSHLDY
jgi:ADP-dependent NAD(P)H-hydrate dehydratase